MIDQFGRTIDYMRISVTDHCNLRCKYCMPEGVCPVKHSECLTYEEILHVCAAAVSLGIVKFKITGGEPLMRKGCAEFISRLKAVPGVEQVTLTTNGLLLSEKLDELSVDAINISLDTLDEREYGDITGFYDGAPRRIADVLAECVRHGICVKINSVLLKETFGNFHRVAMLAREMPVDVRFIELMPIGAGVAVRGVGAGTAFSRLKELWPDLRPTDEKRGNGPARYYASNGLMGRIGFISAVSGQFCGSCNRVRLTSTGVLKPCLCYGDGMDLKGFLRENHSDTALREAIRSLIEAKPREHCFSRLENITEHKAMSQIGG